MKAVGLALVLLLFGCNDHLPPQTCISQDPVIVCMCIVQNRGTGWDVKQIYACGQMFGRKTTITTITGTTGAER